MIKIGNRVGTIIFAKSDTKIVNFVGYGIYRGNVLPPLDIGPCAAYRTTTHQEIFVGDVK